jgi:thiol-disulfide isomerase/thioredoxin
MKRLLLTAAILAIASPAAAQIFAQPKQTRIAPADPAAAAAKFNAVVGQALQHLGKADNYVLTVDSQWKASGDELAGQAGRSHYRMLAKGKKYRIEVRSDEVKSPQLIAANDGQHMTTILLSENLYSRHAVGSPQASLESNQLLAQSLAGSAIDILLQPNVSEYVSGQATDLAYHGQEQLDGRACHRFELVWASAKVQLWFAAAGDPLLVQFVRTACVPTSDDTSYELVHTARFQWQLNAKLADDAFTISLPKEARRVNDIYDVLSGDDPTARIGHPLPKLELSQLDGGAIDVAVPDGKKGLVLIFWASWCAPSVEEMASVSQFVKAGASQGVAFYAVNVGEAPGDVRRFTAKSPLASAVALDPKGQASSALRVTELPAAVVVGPDNKVRAIVSGTAKEVQAGVAKELAVLLTESPAAPKTARRPNETPK